MFKTSRRRSKPMRYASSIPRAVESLEVRSLLSGNTDSAMSADLGPTTAFVGYESPQALQDYLVSLAVQRNQGLFGQPGGMWWPCPMCRYGDVLFATAPGGATATAEHSETNVQVQGVDEGDLVETDGQRLFVISENTLSVVDVREPGSPHVVWSHTWDNNSRPDSIYLDHDRLTVVSSTYGMYYPIATDVVATSLVAPYPLPSEMTPPHVTVSVYDVSQGDVPQEVYHTDFDGSLVTSRSINGEVYLILQQNLDIPAPRLIEVTDTTGTTKAIDTSATSRFAMPPIYNDGKSYIYETEASYRAWLAEHPIDVIPSYKTMDPTGQVLAVGDLTSATTIRREVGPDPYQVITVASINSHANSGTPDHNTSLLTNFSGQVYMSAESIYLFRSEWTELGTTTGIVKFGIEPNTGDIQLQARGHVGGNLLNRFSADEYQGFLRVATTEGWGINATNHVYVVGPSADLAAADTLSIVGSVEVVKGETIFSARFLGPQAYVVTFLRTDPLFRIDLSDPTAPRVVGELVIPGFSDYLHPVEGGYLIGLGRDADPNTGRATGLQVSLFDVRGDQPQLVSRYALTGDTMSWSDATFDPHAFAYYADQGVLALPISSYTMSLNGMYIPSHTLHVLSVSPANGIHPLGKLQDAEPIWRSVRIEDKLVAVSAHRITITPIHEPSTIISQLEYRANAPVFVDKSQDLVSDKPDANAAAISLAEGSAYVTSGLESAGDTDVYLVPLSKDGTLTLNAKFDGSSPLRVTLLDINRLTMFEYEFNPSGQAEIDLSKIDHDQMYLSVSAADGSSTGVYAVSLQWTPPAETNPTDPTKLSAGHVADLNGDGSVDAADADLLFRDWGAVLPAIPSVPGDLNRDGWVDAADASLLFADWTGDSAGFDIGEPGLANPEQKSSAVTTNAASAEPVSAPIWGPRLASEQRGDEWGLFTRRTASRRTG